MSKLYNPTTAGPLLHNAVTGKPGLSRQRVRDLCAAGRLGQRIAGGRGWIITAAEIERFNQEERKRGVKK